MSDRSPIEEALEGAMRSRELPFQAQAKVGNFLCDFIFPAAMLIVECDGHDFHSTKEQLLADAKRDRILVRMGWTVVRYRGAEIHADARLCALEIKEILEIRTKAQIKISKSLVDWLDSQGHEVELLITDYGIAAVIKR